LDTAGAPAVDAVAKPEAPKAKKSNRAKRPRHPNRSARRKGDGPQDRSEAAKRHQGRMMAQSARRTGSVSRHASRKR
jgi:hypothetical protein